MTELLMAAKQVADDVPDGTVFRWAALIAGQGIILIGLILGYLGTHRGVNQVNDVASKAAELAKPTGNGFADRTEEALREIKEGLQRVEAKVDTHIQDHARSSFKEK